MTTASQAIAPGRRLIVRRIVRVLAAAVIVVLGWYGWWVLTGPVPPEVPVGDLDPAIRARIDNGRLLVRALPMSGWAWGRLGVIFWAHEFPAAADVCLAQAERLQPRHFRWFYIHGVALQPEQPRRAVSYLQQAVDFQEDTRPEPRLRLGRLLLELGRLDEAQAQFEEVLRQDADNPQARLSLAQIAAAKGRNSECEEWLAKSTAGSTQKSARSLRAELLAQQGDIKAAQRERQLARELPDDPPWPDPVVQEALRSRVGQRASIDRSTVLLERGETAAAIALLQKTAQEYPRSALVWLKLGNAQLAAHQLAEAETSLRRAVDLDGEASEAHIQLGVVREKQGEYASAVSSFRKALALRPDAAVAYFDLGVCLAQLNQRADAREAFRSAIRYKPHLTQAYVSLAELLAADGALKEARAELERARSLSPDNPQVAEALRRLPLK